MKGRGKQVRRSRGKWRGDKGGGEKKQRNKARMRTKAREKGNDERGKKGRNRYCILEHSRVK